MASSSTYFTVPQSKYDVFLSFRGEDTRYNFTSHLHTALCQKSISTFIDDEAIQKGDTLSSTLLAAIERSRISIIIFSKNYASSTWCLDELEKIIECKEKKEHVVIPVFYHVDPSDVRHQRGTYKDAFTKHEERFRDNPLKVQKWRTVLHEAANLVGWDSSNIRLESELVEKIVGDVLQKLNHMYPYTDVSKGLVGITEKIAEVKSLLCIGLADVRIIGIWGMAGIDIGMRSLEDKSLITVSQNQMVQMHDLIQEMGWQIVREESIKDPGKRSRLWDPKEIYDVLKYNKGIDTVESIALDTSQIKDVTISPQTFTRMHKLRFLNFYTSPHKRSNVHISKDLEAMPDELIYFRWDYFPLKSLPSSFCAEKLVELYLKHSLVEKLWDGMQDLVGLKKLNLSGCKHMIELPDLSMASKLRKLRLDGCTSLLNVPSYILSLDGLCGIDLGGCEQLVYIQSDTHPRSLQWLDLNGCLRLAGFSVYSEKLEFLDLGGTVIEKLPPIWDTCVSITTLRLDWCSNLSELPENIGLLSALKSLSVIGSNIETLPGSIKNLSHLRVLKVKHCRRLLSLPELPPLLRFFDASHCISLKTVSNSGFTLLQNSFSRQSKSSLLRQIQEQDKTARLYYHDGYYRARLSMTTCYFGKFKYYNCKKLDQNARKALMEEAVTRIQLAAYLSSMIEASYDPYYQPEPDDEVSKKSDPENIKYIPLQVDVILPGSEVPNWFSHKETDSSTITVKLPSLFDCYCNYLGFALCLVLGPTHSNREKNERIPCQARCKCYFGKKFAGWCCVNFFIDDAETDLVWLCYQKFSNKEKETGDLDTVNVSFQFSIEPCRSELVVKQCGIRPLYAPDDIRQSSNEQEGKRPYVE